MAQRRVKREVDPVQIPEPTFFYNSSYWTNKESFNLLNGTNDDKEVETKLPTYWSTPVAEICLYDVDAGGAVLITNYQARSLYHLIADGKNRSISNSISSWFNFGGFSGIFQCGIAQGFNVEDSSGGKVRIGLLSRDPASGCSQPFYAFGAGVEAGNYTEAPKEGQGLEGQGLEGGGLEGGGLEGPGREGEEAGGQEGEAHTGARSSAAYYAGNMKNAFHMHIYVRNRITRA